MNNSGSHLSSWIDNFKLAIQLFFFTSNRLNKILGLYDFITRAHVENVAGLARIAKEILGLGYTEGRLLELAAWLHDLGKSINYDYLSIIFTPRKLEYSDENLHKLMIEHSSQSENKLDELGYDLPVLLRLAIRNHHRFLVRGGEYRDILVDDPDYKELSSEKQKQLIGLLDILMVIDSLSAYTEASRPSNWFKNVVFDKDKIIAMIKKRYGDVFKIDVEYLVRKILEHPKARKLLENNTEHNPSIIARTMKEWAEKESIYDVNYLDMLKGQISAMNEGSDLTGFRNFLTHLTSPVFSVILWEKWAEEVFSEIITTSLENEFINAEIREHLITISREHPHSLFVKVIENHPSLKTSTSQE